MKRPSRPHGAAMVTVIMLMVILAFIVANVLLLAGEQRRRSAMSARNVQRDTCAEAGLQMARSLFACQALKGNWNKLLAMPSIYNPIAAAWITGGNTNANPLTAAGKTLIKAGSAGTGTPAGTSLFVDLDSDGLDDVYLYLRDNDDELNPATSDFTTDNDQNVIVGAMCISTTMVPRRQDGTVDSDKLVLESMLSFNALVNSYTAQAAQGPTGSGNINTADPLTTGTCN